LILTAVGGPQYYDGTWNPASRIQKVALSDLEVVNLLRAADEDEAEEHPDDCLDFRALTSALMAITLLFCPVCIKR
jgi:hypothetical protein